MEDNPWMNAKALAAKTGVVLGDLLTNHIFGSRPALSRYSLGSSSFSNLLRILQYCHQDVFLSSTPVPANAKVWSGIHRLVSGRVVNGFSTGDYVLAILSRISDASWEVAGLQPVVMMGKENVKCGSVDGHMMWRGIIGKCQAPRVFRNISLQMTVALP